MSAIPVLTYHFVGDYPRQRQHRSIFCHAPVFAAQMRLLHRLGWRTMGLSEIGRLAASGHPLPARRFALTFDDGDADLWWSVRPVLRAHGFTASVFIVSGRIGGTNDWETAPTLAGRPLLNADQIRAMAADGWDIGGHTVSHVDLTTLSREDRDREVNECSRQLEEVVGTPVTSFCYPSGRVDAASRNAVCDAGFHVAVTTEKGCVRSGADPLLLPRVGVSHRAGPAGLLFRIATSRQAAVTLASDVGGLP